MINLKEMVVEEIWMSGEFNEESAMDVRKKILDRASISSSMPIVIYINSPGGSISALAKIIDTLDSLPNPVITVCCGQASSAGAVLLARGDKAFIGKNSTVMIHKASSGIRGNDVEMLNEAKSLAQANDMMIEYISKKTKKNKKKIKALLDSNVDINLTAKEAVEFGIVDAIGVPLVMEKTIYEVVVK